MFALENQLWTDLLVICSSPQRQTGNYTNCHPLCGKYIYHYYFLVYYTDLHFKIIVTEHKVWQDAIHFFGSKSQV